MKHYRPIEVSGGIRALRYGWALIAIIFLSGCRQEVTIEDNGPTEHDRKWAMVDCTGKTYPKEASAVLRVLCTFAVYQR